MRHRSSAFLTRQEILKSKTKKRRAPRVLLKTQDAFQFLSELKSNSVDLIVSSPPYCIGKEYERSVDTVDFLAMHERLAPMLVRALKNGGSLCWQVGHHVKNGVVTPLDSLVYSIFSKHEQLVLRNRIVWTFAHGVHASNRFSGRHETILWFTKGDEYTFNLDSVRVPQKYPGKRHYKGPNKGKFSGNPLGKNPSDVWDIPNVKANHIEKTTHPCQFPVALAQRLIRALTKREGLVVDPFLGSGTTAVAAAIDGRRFRGCEIDPNYAAIAKSRVAKARAGSAEFRPLDKAIHVPSPTDAVAKRPSHFRR